MQSLGLSDNKGRYQRAPTEDPHQPQEETGDGRATSSSSEDEENTPDLTLRKPTRRGSVNGDADDESDESPDNKVDAQRAANNRVFGLKKWRGPITRRQAEKADLVKELYASGEDLRGGPRMPLMGDRIDDNQYESRSGVGRFLGNVVYVLLFGWWVSIVYVVVALLMLLTIVGRDYCRYCLTLAKFFLWPFGQFIHRDDPNAYLTSFTEKPAANGHIRNKRENIPLIGERPLPVKNGIQYGMDYWKRTQSFIWCAIGIPILMIVHSLVFFATWMTIIFIPIARLQGKTMRRVLFMPPELLRIERNSFSVDHPASDIIVYSDKACNVHYYKYTVDGVNVILVNMLFFVIVAVLCGYCDPEGETISVIAKFVMSLIAIIPLSYYIGLAITSISAQSSPAIGALLNASFGSGVELMLYTLALFKATDRESRCYTELVKSGFIGTVLAMIMMMPGLCMILGGCKYSTLKFNPRSSVVSSSLLFVCLACVFAPTIYGKIYGATSCQNCHENTQELHINGTSVTVSLGTYCERCTTQVFEQHGDPGIYNEYIRPLVFTMAILMPLVYLTGLWFGLKSHHDHIHKEFLESMDGEGGHGSEVAHWSRLKSCTILLISTILMALCADVLTENLEPILSGTGLSVYFIGVTVMAIVPDIPEVVNGVLFALHNNISLSIEVGTCMAVQVCMMQIPLLIMFSTIWDLKFYLVFDDIHLWAIVLAVLMMNYMFQDGKADYFQGVAVIAVYIALIAMYFFTPKHMQC